MHVCVGDMWEYTFVDKFILQSGFCEKNIEQLIIFKWQSLRYRAPCLKFQNPTM